MRNANVRNYLKDTKLQSFKLKSTHYKAGFIMHHHKSRMYYCICSNRNKTIGYFTNYNLGVKKNTGIRGAYCVVIFECTDHTLSQTKASKKPHSLVGNTQAKKTKKKQGNFKRDKCFSAPHTGYSLIA